MNPNNRAYGRPSALLPALTTALAAAGAISTAQAQLQVAEELLVNVDATASPFGTLTSITNQGTLGGFFEARGGGTTIPTIGRPNTNSTRGIVFDGTDYLQHVASVGGALIPAPATLIGLNQSCSIEAWVYNPQIPGEETIVSWGKRGGSPDGSNMSFNYGDHGAWGAVGHWGAPDLGWNNAGGAPPAGMWHHLVYTYDGTTQKVFSDGALTNSEVVALNIHSGPAINIGAQYEADGTTVTVDLRASSTIGRLRVHAGALADAQVAQNYNLEKNDFTLGPPVFLTQPQNVTTQEQRMVTFSVTLDGQPPIALQWYRNLSPIPGANGTTVTYGPVTGLDNGSQFYAVASNLSGGSSFMATSTVATLTVVVDTNPPAFNRALALTERSIELVFSEAILADDATNIARYALSGPSPTPVITNAVQNAAGDRVVLSLDAPMECAVYTVAVTNMRDRAPSANTLLSASQSFLNNTRPNLTHRYTFNNTAAANATGATIPDVAGAADGIVKGGGATLTGTRLTLAGGASGTAAYVDLPNQLLSNNSTNRGGSGKVTLEGWVKVTGVQSWSRIIDFGSNIGGELPGPGGGGSEGRDYLFYSAMNGTDPNLRQIDFRNEDPGGGGGVFTTYGTLTFNQDFHFVITWDEFTGLITVYENGVQVATTLTDDPMSDLNDVNVWLGRSNWTVDANMQGEFDEFRMYNRLLNTNEIRVNRIGGPDNNFGMVTSLNLTLHTNSAFTNTVGPASVRVGFTGVGLQEMASSGCIRYTSTDSNVAYISADGIVHVGSAGTATLSADLGGFTNSQVINVIIDVDPPTLVNVRSAGPRTIELIYSEPVDEGTAEEPSNYIISGLSGIYSIFDVHRQNNQARVLITLDDPMQCEYITVFVSFVADQSPLFNQIAENSPISFYNFVPPGLRHRYTFNNSVTNNGSFNVVRDAVGTGDALVQGNGSSFNGNQLVLPGGPSATAAYVDLPNQLLTANSTNVGGSGKVTFEGWVKVTGSRTWGRILDIGNSGPCCGPGGEQTGPGGGGEGIDYLMLSAQVGGDVNNRRFEIMNRDHPNNAGTITMDHPTAFNQMRQFVITWDERTGDLQVYEDGVLRITTATSIPYTANNDVNVWLGRSNWAPDQNMQGDFDEFRVYDKILSTAEILRNRTLGPDFTFGAVTSLNLTLTSGTMEVGREQPVSVVGGFSAAGLQELGATACVRYSSDNPGVAFISADGVLHAVAPGTTTVRVQLDNTNDAETITVIADTVKPTLTSVLVRGTHTLELVFSEAVDEGTAEEISNYVVSSAAGNVTIASIERLPNASRVLITLAAPMPCEYMTVSVNNVADLYSNAILANSSNGAMHYTATGMQHRYTFNTAPLASAHGAVVPDAVGSGDAVVLGGGASLTGTRVRLAGGQSQTAGYVDLPNRLLSSNSLNNGGSGQITIEGWARVTGNRNWGRLFDFGSTEVSPGVGGELFGPGGGNAGLDYLFLSAQEGGNVNRHVVDIRNVDGLPSSDPGGPGFNGAPFNTDFHFAVTWSELTGQVVVYENGVQVAAFSAAGTPMSRINDVNCWLGRSNWTGDLNAQAEYDEFRVYDRVLSLGELQMNQQIGPDNALGQPVAVRLGGTNHVQIGQRLAASAIVDFNNLSNLNFTASGCAIFESGNTNILSIDAGGIRGVGLGTADLIVRFSGLSNSIPVIVGYQFQLRGLTPGFPYNVQVATQITGPWSNIGTVAASGAGTIDFEDTVPRGPQAFYRAQLIPE
jgi:hypothetical protein